MKSLSIDIPKQKMFGRYFANMDSFFEILTESWDVHVFSLNFPPFLSSIQADNIFHTSLPHERSLAGFPGFCLPTEDNKIWRERKLVSLCETKRDRRFAKGKRAFSRSGVGNRSAGSWTEGTFTSTLEAPKGVAEFQEKSPGDKPGGLDAKLRVLALSKSPYPMHGMEMAHWWTWWAHVAAAKSNCYQCEQIPSDQCSTAWT